MLDDQINVLGRLGHRLDGGRGHNVGQSREISVVFLSRKQHGN